MVNGKAAAQVEGPRLSKPYTFYLLPFTLNLFRIMIRNYVIVTFRHLYKKKMYTLINLLGITISTAACLLIILYVTDELSYDQFHKNADCIYRVTTRTSSANGESQMAATNYHVAEVMGSEVPEVVNTTRVEKFWNWTVQHDSSVFTVNDIVSADSNFFEFFTFPLLQGSAATALTDPASVVLTEAAAQKYFGNTEVVGKLLTVNGEEKQVTAIAQNPPRNAHFHFSIVVPFLPRVDAGTNWSNVSGVMSTYFLKAENASLSTIETKLEYLYDRYHDQKGNMKFMLQKITDIHLYSDLQFELESNSDIRYVYILSAVAVLILILAIVNYVNLATARSTERAREVGIRKTLGSARYPLIVQFLLEAFALCLLAVLFSLGLTELLRPTFNALSGKQLAVNVFTDPQILLFSLGIALLVGTLAGLYPALYLSQFRPIQVLKGGIISGRKASMYRNALVVFQFTVSAMLIFSTIIAYQQLQYLQNKQLGYDKENVILLGNPGQEQYRAFVNAIQNHSDVLAVTASSESPHRINNGIGGISLPDKQQEYNFNWIIVEPNFIKTMGINLKSGRDFNPDLASDKASVILNEAAITALGLDQQVVGHTITLQGEVLQIIGVIENFHFQPLQESIQPILLGLDMYDGAYQIFNTIEVKIGGNNLQSTIAHLKKEWKELAPDKPFSYSFLDESYAALYRSEIRLRNIFAVFTTLIIVIACLGLLALAAFTAEQRTKEIGIRKVLGASVQSIVSMFTTSLTKLILIALVIAYPAGYWMVQLWLNTFAYRIDITFDIFVATGVIALITAMLTVSYQSIKAALANPVDSLRDE
jgi:putative ABC transport system permease protein